MKEQLPAPDFNSRQYERPNQDWICGHDCEGTACRRGPDARGRCRTTAECQPVLEKKSGEAKGRWRCTRTAELGGPCANGPQPDGVCGCPIVKCVPVRSLRAKRKRFMISVMAFTAAILLIGICGPFRAKFLNPGALSSQHATEAFAKMAGGAADAQASPVIMARKPARVVCSRRALARRPGHFSFVPSPPSSHPPCRAWTRAARNATRLTPSISPTSRANIPAPPAIANIRAAAKWRRPRMRTARVATRTAP